MTLHINDAGTWRAIQELYVNDNGVWRAIQEAYVNDAGTWRTVYVAELIALADLTALAQAVASAATAQYQLGNDGNVSATQGSNTLIDVGDWITPQTNMANYEARVDMTSGSLSSGTTGAWQSLATSRVWVLNRSAIAGDGTSTAQGTVQIRRASDAVVLATATITWTATIIP